MQPHGPDCGPTITVLQAQKRMATHWELNGLKTIEVSVRSSGRGLLNTLISLTYTCEMQNQYTSILFISIPISQYNITQLIIFKYTF